jgi:two-component system, LytTR family, sensor kinase
LPLRPKYNWLVKYKLYHIPFWFVYHYLWWVLRTGSATEPFEGILTSPYSIKFSSYVIWQAIGVYFNLYYLIPRFLEKGRYIQYFLLLVLTIICTASLIVTGYYASCAWSGYRFDELYPTMPDNFLYLFKTNTLASTIASMTFGMSVKLAKNWIQEKRKQQVLEKEKLETELKFLKSQFNPHFLFNTINSIFVLIHKNPDMASDSLAKFSGLLRYQLYECNEHEIPLAQELNYLENFIELQRLRLDQETLEINIQIDHRHSSRLTIAPFILIPFIENAFKHVSREKEKLNWIKIHLCLNGNRLNVDISNSVSTKSASSVEINNYRGIGLQNAKRRLQLVYPEKHLLTIFHDECLFQAKLHLHLHEHRISEPVRISD